jgi:hypothetical protein
MLPLKLVACALHVGSVVASYFEQEESNQELWGPTFMKHKKSNLVPMKRQALVHTALLGFLLYNCH